MAACEPPNFEEANKSQKWHVTMKEELIMIENRKTRGLVDIPQNKKVIGVKWVYRTIKLDWR